MPNIVKACFLVCILIFSFFLRTYKLSEPLADWHSWRQADTAAVARNFVKYGVNILVPKYDDVSDIASGQENPQGYRMVEFPLYSYIHAQVFKIFPMMNFEAAGRLISIFFSLTTIVFLFLIVKEISGIYLGLITAFFYAILPFNIYYNRVILPEPMMITASLGAVYFFLKATKVTKGSSLKIFGLLAPSVIFLAISLLIKPFAVFLIAPPILIVSYQKMREDKKGIYWLGVLSIFWIIGLVPFLLWRSWITRFPEGIPANMWLLNGDAIRFKGAWFYWLFAERLAKLILGFWGLPLLVLGILAKTTKKEDIIYNFWLVGILAYLAVVATGNVRHDYYQILIIPVICLFLARGSLLLLGSGRKIFSSLGSYLILAISVFFMGAFGWYQVRDFFNINHPEIVKAGKAVQQISRPGDKVIAPYMGDTAFLYQTNRKGWPIGGNIADKIAKGAKYYVSVNTDQESKELQQNCEVVASVDNYLIIALQDCRLPK